MISNFWNFRRKKFCSFSNVLSTCFEKILKLFSSKKVNSTFFFRICSQNIGRLSKTSGSVVKNDSWVSRETSLVKVFFFEVKECFLNFQQLKFGILKYFISALLSKLLSLCPIESFAEKQRNWQKTSSHCFFSAFENLKVPDFWIRTSGVRPKKFC